MKPWTPYFSIVLLIAMISFAVAQGPFDETPAKDTPAAKKETPATNPIPFQSKHPTVVAVMASNPDSPPSWAFAADMLAQHGETDLAKQFLQKLLDANLDDAGWLKLIDRYGAVLFKRLGSNPEIQPQGGEVAKAALGALEQKLGDPKRIKRLINDLKSPTDDTRIRAIAGLRESGAAAVVPLLEVLADPKRKAEFVEVRSVLEYLDKDATRQLIAAARSPNTTLAVQAIEVLKSTGAGGASIYLLAPATSPKSDPTVRKAAEAALETLTGRVANTAQAVQILTDRAKLYLNRLNTPLGIDNINHMVEVWQWDDTQKMVAATKYPTRLADAVVATILTKDALALNPANEKSRQMYLMAELERLGLSAENDATVKVDDALAAQITKFDPGPIMTALENALLTDRTTAAIVAVKLLGRFGPDQMKALLENGIKPTPLLYAARSGNPHLRFAALEVILALNPTTPFPGSSYVPESLAFMAAATGERRAMVAARTTVEARRVGSFLNALGYDIETATSGNEMMQKLITSPDFEIVFIDARIEKPKINILVQKLRRDGRTAGLPVAVITPDGFTDLAENAADNHPLAKAFPRPHDQKSVEWQLSKLTPQTARSAITPELRLKHAATALGHLNRLKESKNPLFALNSSQTPALSAIYLPQLSEKAITLLGQFGNPEAQKALVDLASSQLQPIADRQKALAAFQKSVNQKGVLLTTGQILLQYNRYNASENADRQTQQVLGEILNTIEGTNQISKK